MSIGRSISLCVALVLGLALRAQQDPLFSQYMFNTLAFNPGYAGSADVMSIMGLSRHQWVGFDGAPATQTLALHAPLKTKNLSLGGMLMHDVAGPARNTGAFVDVAYRIRTGKKSRLAFGLKGGLNVFQADIAALSTVDPDPSAFNLNGKLMPNFGFGVFWHAERWYVGLSAPKLLENRIGEQGMIYTGREARHFYAMGGYVFDLNTDVKFRPSIMLRAVEGAPLSLDLNANFLLQDRLWLGAMYRWGNGTGIMVRYQINEQLTAGYAFDLTTKRIGAYNAGTHEIMLGYDMRFTKGRTISPRYF